MSDSDSQSLVLIGQRPFRPCAHMAPMGLSAARPEGMPFAIAAVRPAAVRCISGYYIS